MFVFERSGERTVGGVCPLRGAPARALLIVYQAVRARRSRQGKMPHRRLPGPASSPRIAAPPSGGAPATGMTPALLFWISLLLKMAVTAGFV
ncbi:MAG: hypothetical protein J0H63_15075, partial [Rhizobiales bacterium]|nr:hypothetical protein [Hyphomicrobiales bacterium]